MAGPLPLLGALNHWGRYLYPKVLPSAYCVLLAGPLPLQGALNHWGRYLPQGPTICILCASPLAGPLPLKGALNHWGRYLPQGPTICMMCASGGATPLKSLCRAPLTTGVNINPKVLPSAYCVLLAGPLPLQGALNHWGRYLPQGPTICILCRVQAGPDFREKSLLPPEILGRSLLT